MPFDRQLARQRALVTGGTKGVGAAVAKTLHDAEGRPDDGCKSEQPG